MNIKQQFEILLDKEYKFSLINEVNALKEQCILENNTEYYNKCNLLISDIYIEHQNFDEALNLLLKEQKKLDKVVFKNIYFDFLDRLIYLYINKRNYNVALRYISQKEKLIDKNNNDVLNRLYLEYSYVYGNKNDLNKAEEYLLKILNNSPTIALQSVVYSNLTKICIDKEDVENAKKYLNESLMYSNDHEGEVYNDYLLAKVCALEGKTNDALHLYESIFVNEDINSMTLSMMNDYLKLLNKLKKYNKSLLLMNKLSIFFNATTDYVILHDFLQNKLDYFIGIKDNTNIISTRKEIEAVKKIIEENEQAILNANIEEDINDAKEKSEEEVFNKINLLTSLVDTALRGNTLREIIMDFGIKTQKIINFDEFQFVLFNKVNEKEYQISNEINVFKFKNNRLYEKNISYEDLKGSIVELMVNNNKPVIIDFNNFNVDVKDVFTNKMYDREVFKYLNAMPCIYKDDTFATVIYCSKDTDLTDHANTILLKIATKLIESPLIIQFIEENNRIIDNLNNFIIDEYNIGLFQLNNNTMYLSNNLKELLKLKNNVISIDNYKKKISKSDLNKYEDHLKTNNKSKICYKFELDNKIIQLEEVINPVTNVNGKVLYYQGYIKSLENDNLGYALSEKDLLLRISELKQKTREIEFKFSMIKIRGNVDEYQDIKSKFGVEPFFLNDGTFVVILENEANQRTLDRLVKEYSDRSAIIRYPRDIINIDEMLEVASIMMDDNILHFSNDVYRIFIKRNNLANKLDSILDRDLKLNAFSYISNNNDEIYEIKPVIFGFDDKDLISSFIKGELLNKFDNKFVDTFINCSFKENCFFSLSNNMIYRLLTEYDNETIKNIDVVMYEFNKITPVIMEKLKEQNKQLYIDYNMINKLDAYYFTTGVIKGIYVGSNNNIDINKLFKLLSMFDLRLICYNSSYDYEKIYYYNNQKKMIN